MPANGSKNTYNWPDIRQRFLRGEWEGLDEVAKATGVSYNHLRKVAGQERWHTLRAEAQQQAEQKALARVREKLAREYEKRLQHQLDSADVLRVKGVDALADKDMKLNGSEAIRAVLGAAEIENDIFHGSGVAEDGSTQGDAAHREVRRIIIEQEIIRPGAKRLGRRGGNGSHDPADED